MKKNHQIFFILSLFVLPIISWNCNNNKEPLNIDKNVEKIRLTPPVDTVKPSPQLIILTIGDTLNDLRFFENTKTSSSSTSTGSPIEWGKPILLSFHGKIDTVGILPKLQFYIKDTNRVDNSVYYISNRYDRIPRIELNFSADLNPDSTQNIFILSENTSQFRNFSLISRYIKPTPADSLLNESKLQGIVSILKFDKTNKNIIGYFQVDFPTLPEKYLIRRFKFYFTFHYV